MVFLEKIAFLENKLHFNDGAFCARYKIKLGLLKKWKSGQASPTAKDIRFICKDFNLDATDFLDDSSTLSKDIKENEHPCATKPKVEKPNEIYEDFVREDNSRYEEKD